MLTVTYTRLGKKMSRNMKRVLWFMMLFASAMSVVLALFLFEKSPVMAIVVGILSMVLLRLALLMGEIYGN